MKICVVGASGAGKSQFIQSQISHVVVKKNDPVEKFQVEFQAQAFFLEGFKLGGGKNSKINLWDIPSTIDNLTKLSLKNTQAFVLVMDPNKKESLEATHKWVEEIISASPQQDIPPIFLLVNKVDKFNGDKSTLEEKIKTIEQEIQNKNSKFSGFLKIIYCAAKSSENKPGNSGYLMAKDAFKFAILLAKGSEVKRLSIETWIDRLKFTGENDQQLKIWKEELVQKIGVLCITDGYYCTSENEIVHINGIIDLDKLTNAFFKGELVNIRYETTANNTQSNTSEFSQAMAFIKGFAVKMVKSEWLDLPDEAIEKFQKEKLPFYLGIFGVKRNSYTPFGVTTTEEDFSKWYENQIYLRLK